MMVGGGVCRVVGQEDMEAITLIVVVLSSGNAVVSRVSPLYSSYTSTETFLLIYVKLLILFIIIFVIGLNYILNTIVLCARELT